MTDPVEPLVPPDPAELKERARLFSELEAALDANIKEAEFLAGEALATARLPLVSARWSKLQLELNIRSTRRIQAGEEMSQVNIEPKWMYFLKPHLPGDGEGDGLGPYD